MKEDNMIEGRYVIKSKYDANTDLLTCSVADRDKATTKSMIKKLDGQNRTDMEFYLYSQMGFGDLIIEGALREIRASIGDKANFTQWSHGRSAA